MATKIANTTAKTKHRIKTQSVVTLDCIGKNQFDAMMQKGYDEAQAGIGLSVDEAFKKIREVIGG